MTHNQICEEKKNICTKNQVKLLFNQSKGKTQMWKHLVIYLRTHIKSNYEMSTKKNPTNVFWTTRQANCHSWSGQNRCCGSLPFFQIFFRSNEKFFLGVKIRILFFFFFGNLSCPFFSQILCQPNLSCQKYCKLSNNVTNS